MKTFVPYKRKILSKSKYYKDLMHVYPYFSYMCKICGYPLGTHFSGVTDFTSVEEYNGICPVPENGKDDPKRYYDGNNHTILPVFYPEELNTNTKVL